MTYTVNCPTCGNEWYFRTAKEADQEIREWKQAVRRMEDRLVSAHKRINELEAELKKRDVESRIPKSRKKGIAE